MSLCNNYPNNNLATTYNNKKSADINNRWTVSYLKGTERNNGLLGNFATLPNMDWYNQDRGTRFIPSF